MHIEILALISACVARLSAHTSLPRDFTEISVRSLPAFSLLSCSSEVGSFVQEDRHWSQYFTQRITGKVKLVGPTISCQNPAVALQGEVGEAPPHVQLSALATDQVRIPSVSEQISSRFCFLVQAGKKGLLWFVCLVHGQILVALKHSGLTSGKAWQL